MSDLDKNIPPVPEHTNPLVGDAANTSGGKRMSQVWTRWFLAVREKVNVLNASIVNLAGEVGSGFLSGNGDQWSFRSITGASGRVSVSNGNGVGGNPVVDLVSVGSPGTHQLANVTVDEFGRVTAASSAVTGTDTVATAGAAPALPATPEGYIVMVVPIAGTPTTVKVPYYLP